MTHREDTEITPSHPPRPAAVAVWLIRLLTLAAIGVSGYLLSVSLMSQGLPLGCGAGSGCEVVLSSRWSNVFGIPVSGLAACIYLAMFAASCTVSPHFPLDRQRTAWSVLLLLAFVVAGSAVWFVFLQAVVLRAFCPWCMAGHGIGLLLAAIVLRTVVGPKLERSKSPESPIPRFSDDPRDVAPEAAAAPEESGPVAAFPSKKFALLGVFSVAGLIAAQLLVPVEPHQVQRLPAGQNADTGPGPNRLVSVLDGSLQLAPHDVPSLGSADAPKLLILLFDYCCPHCRKTHGYLMNARERYGDQFAILALPTPLNSDCNKFVEETERRFEHACELAQLALAVWRADPESFEEFDRFLFEPEMPRTPDEARSKAESLVMAEPLRRALEDSWIDERIAQDVEAYQQSTADRIPVILSPGFASIVGRPESEEQLFEILENELKLRPQPP